MAWPRKGATPQCEPTIRLAKILRVVFFLVSQVKHSSAPAVSRPGPSAGSLAPFQVQAAEVRAWVSLTAILPFPDGEAWFSLCLSRQHIKKRGQLRHLKVCSFFKARYRLTSTTTIHLASPLHITPTSS